MRNELNTLAFALLCLLSGWGLMACSDDDNLVELPVVEMPQTDAGAFSIDYRNILDAGSYLYEYKISIDKPASRPLICMVEVADSLVDVYNAAHGTNYQVMPSNVYSLQGTDAIIKTGETESNSLGVKFNTLYGMEEGGEYLLPIMATLDESCVGLFDTDVRSISYIRMSIDGELDYISGLNMSTYSGDMYRTLTFPNDEVVTIENNTHTYEMLLYAYAWHSSINYLVTWKGVDSNKNDSFTGCDIYASGTAGNLVASNRQCDLSLASKGNALPTKQWFRLTITCDGAQTGQNTEVAYHLYINGEEIASAAPVNRWGTASSHGFQVGYTMTGIQLGYTRSYYYFNGLISEIRMWKRCLSADEVKANLRKVALPNTDDFYGYWRMDEGSGNILKDCSGNGRDLVFPESASVAWGAELNNIGSGN